MVTVNMPVIGQDIPTGVVVEWFKKEGDSIEKEEVIATVESEKAAFEVEAPASGILLKIVGQAGDEIEVLTPIAYIGEPGESVEETAKVDAKEQEKPKVKSEEVTSQARVSNVEKANTGKVHASPLARRIARELGISIKDIKGTGPGGRIIKKNVLSAASQNNVSKSSTMTLPIQGAISAASPQDVLSDDRVVPYTRMRQTIADRMSVSKNTVPHFYLTMDVDMRQATIWRKKFNEDENEKITITDIISYASAKALREYPKMNSHAYQNQMVIKRQINIGIATSVEDGLLVPIIPQVDLLGIDELSKEIKQRIDKARKGVLDFQNKGTFTISSLGMFGIREFTPIINTPESAILAVGAIESRVVSKDGMIGLKDMMSLTLACDHRSVDGAYGARFLQKIKEILEAANFKTFKY